MIKLLLIGALLTFWGYTCTQSSQPAVSSVATLRADTVSITKVDFKADIQPILQEHCTPCHFTGGKMYEKMPFDNPQTIWDHPDGIMRRIKDPGEADKLKTFLSQKEL